MNERDLRVTDDLLARAPRAPSVPPFEQVRARAERESMVPALSAVVAVTVLLFLIVARPERDGAPAASVSRPIDIGAGVALAAPSGDAIAVTDLSSLRIVDPAGKTLATSAAVLRYPKWLPDASGLVGVMDRPNAGVDVRLPLAIVERDGRVSPLNIDVPTTSLAYLSISADGRSIALQDGPTVVIVDRAGGGARAAGVGALVGWDSIGRVLLRDGGSIVAVAADGSRHALVGIGVPSRVESRLSPDGVAAILVGPGAAFAVRESDLVALPSTVSSAEWMGARELLGRRPSGRLFAFDVRSLSERDLVASLDEDGWSSLRAISGDVALWFRASAGEAHLVDLATGGERIVGGLSATSTFQPLADGRFLVTGRETLVIGAR